MHHLQDAELGCCSNLGRFSLLQALRQGRKLAGSLVSSGVRGDQLLLCADELLRDRVVLALKRSCVARRCRQLRLKGGDLHMNPHCAGSPSQPDR